MADGFSKEQLMVIRAFQQGFEKYRHRKIVLYGVGINTDAVLRGTKGFSVIGLMDAASEGQMKFGLPVYSAEAVANMEEKPIIAIIARQSVVNIIYTRIAWLSEICGIEIYDFEGHKLDQKDVEYSNENLAYWDCDLNHLKQQIDTHDIVTFDIFDTLLMRRVLDPTDVFELLDRKLQLKGISLHFKQIRIAAEKELEQQGVCPKLTDIYVRLAEKMSGAAFAGLLDDIRNEEMETDRQVMLIRRTMLMAYRYAVEAGKKVYLLSDMYYEEAYLKELLCSFGVEGYEELWVSCEKKCAKSDGYMYHRFAEHLVSMNILPDSSIENKHRVLHIGDNRYSDYNMAREYGFDAYLIYSAKELLQASALQGIMAHAVTLEQRVILGTIVARIGNDPFAFHKTKGYYEICDGEDIGYCFVGPIILEFVKWMTEQVNRKHVCKILFPSRDGYLLQKVYQKWAAQDAPESVYFRASRRAVTVAALKNEDDIHRIAKRVFRGTCRAFLETRFGVLMREEDVRCQRNYCDMTMEEKERLLKDYKEEIYQRATMERENYKNYLQHKGIVTGNQVAMFDFVASGTVQYSLEKLLNTDLQGIYFATMNLPNAMYELNTKAILSAYGNIESYKADTNLGKHYLLMEAVLVDGKNTLLFMDQNLKAVYDTSNGRKNIHNIMKLQQEALKYVDDYVTCFRGLGGDLMFADLVYGLLFSDACIVPVEVKDIFENDDSYDGQDMQGVFGT